tara:strand:- start:857 stop:1078 length:222 start_codon:yes stop_codon:yes gene_type:complete
VKPPPEDERLPVLRRYASPDALRVAEHAASLGVQLVRFRDLSYGLAREGLTHSPLLIRGDLQQCGDLLHELDW